MNTDPPLDLVVLVPGKDDRETLDGLLSKRHESLGIRSIRYQILVHPRRDPGCFHEAPDILQVFQRRARRALVILDHEGSGQEKRALREVAADLKRRLAASGWGDRAAAIIIAPELETWVWSDSPHVDRTLGWGGRAPRLRDWLAAQGLWPANCQKPPRPKESFQAALREAKIRLSSAIFRELAERVGLKDCQDQTFQQFRDLMQDWFPAGGQT
jgi:hypothetical protein